MVEAAQKIFSSLFAQREIYFYLQKFRVRYISPQNQGEIEQILEDLLVGQYEGLEIIWEFYPQFEDEAISRIQASVIEDFHVGEQIPTDSACKILPY